MPTRVTKKTKPAGKKPKGARGKAALAAFRQVVPQKSQRKGRTRAEKIAIGRGARQARKEEGLDPKTGKRARVSARAADSFIQSQGNRGLAARSIVAGRAAARGKTLDKATLARKARKLRQRSDRRSRR